MSSFRMIRGLSILAAAILPLNSAIADPTPSSTAVNPESPAAAAPATAPQDGVKMAATDPMDAAAQAAAATSADESYKLKAGDPNVITNGPIPDTRENRAKYGLPDSRAGRHSRPVGN